LGLSGNNLIRTRAENVERREAWKDDLGRGE
jgi:hypothetical protein